MEELVHAKNAEELSGVVTVKQKKGRPLLMAKLMVRVDAVPQSPPPAPTKSTAPGQIP
jgi:hypothetical protein